MSQSAYWTQPMREAVKLIFILDGYGYAQVTTKADVWDKQSLLLYHLRQCDAAVRILPSLSSWPFMGWRSIIRAKDTCSALLLYDYEGSESPSPQVSPGSLPSSCPACATTIVISVQSQWYPVTSKDFPNTISRACPLGVLSPRKLLDRKHFHLGNKSIKKLCLHTWVWFLPFATGCILATCRSGHGLCPRTSTGSGFLPGSAWGFPLWPGRSRHPMLMRGPLPGCRRETTAQCM